MEKRAMQSKIDELVRRVETAIVSVVEPLPTQSCNCPSSGGAHRADGVGLGLGVGLGGEGEEGGRERRGLLRIGRGRRSVAR